MHVTQIVHCDSTRIVGPAFFSGSRERQYSSLKTARSAANNWCDKNGIDRSKYKIVSSTVEWSC